MIFKGTLNSLFKPIKFMRGATVVLPWSLLCMILFLNIGYIWALVFAPADAQQGIMVKVMYLHVPCAWLALLSYGLMGIFSLIYLTMKFPLSYVLARSLGVVGITFTSVCLISGSLWGIPTWGTWWVWDARLTSVLILFFLFFTFLVMGRAFAHEERAAKSAAIVGFIGLINLPIIKWSVTWWSTLHQPASIMKLGRPAIHMDMLVPLLICTLGWVCYGISMVLMWARSTIVKQKNEALE